MPCPAGIVNIGSWILSAWRYGLISQNRAHVWVYRRYENFDELGPNERAAVVNNFEGISINLALADFDGIGRGDESRQLFEHFTMQKPDQPLVVSIDLDAGSLNGRAGFERELAAQPWLQQLCARADAVMVFHSPGYSIPRHAAREAAAFRTLHANGYA